ncbi:MAG: CPCC family cysteine-rich protein [Chloroflexota bacterium]
MVYQKYHCPCCGYRTLDEEPPGSYDICPICWWEDDDVDPDFRGGANRVSLNEARENFHQFGASDSRFVGLARRPTEEEQKDRHAW